MFMISIVLIYTYTIQLYIHMVLRLIYTLKSKKISKWKGHAFAITISIIYTLAIYLEYSFCSSTPKEYLPFTNIILLFSFYMVSITSIVYIIREIDENPKVFLFFLILFRYNNQPKASKDI